LEETAVGKRYGNRDGSCHTSNKNLFPDAASVALAAALVADGFVHPEEPEINPSGRIVLEVYPHAAMVALFNLKKTIKYKKGPLEIRRAGLGEVRKLMDELAQAEPALMPTDSLRAFLETDLNRLAGQGLKDYEDKLDALFCTLLFTSGVGVGIGTNSSALLMLLGFPNHDRGDSIHVRMGHISSFRPDPSSPDKLILLNAAVIYGNSGGPVLDKNFRVIGVALRGAQNEAEAQRTEFHAAMPLSVVHDIVASAAEG